MANIELSNENCMTLMARYPDKYFDLAIVDPPYRDTNAPTKQMRRKVNGNMKEFGQKPNESYFQELFRVSKNQIIWGGNNFIEYLYSTNCFIFWYKKNPIKNYSDGELAWTSFDSVARCIPITHFGNHKSDSESIHPTQKPIALYLWLLENYAKQGDKILDTHLGSGSIACACYDLGYDLVACELDSTHFQNMLTRFEKHKLQQKIFVPTVQKEPEKQENLFS